jgi:type VI secretion system protein ImpG
VSKVSADRFLHYYNQELSYLRYSGKNFARQYPKIARRLELSDSESPDPHVERLLESFAFLSGRISQEIDDQYPETATALLNILYPHLVNPIPAMAIAHLQVDPSKGNLTTGLNVPKGTPLSAKSHEGLECQFTTVYPLKLWPIKVKEVSLTPINKYAVHAPSSKEWLMRFDLESLNVDFSAMNLDQLDFHIRCDRKLALLIYQILFAQQNIQAYFSVDGKNIYPLPKESVQPLGFNVDEMSLPMGDHSIYSYQLLQEYFHLPEKFLFFSIKNLLKMTESQDLNSDKLQLYISIDDAGPLYEENLTPDHFLLGATPIVNLFPKTTDPFRLDKKQTHYRLVPDQRLDKTTEIYKIDEIIGSVEGQGEPVVLSPYYSFDHHTTLNPDTVYWVNKRVQAELRELPGTDVYLSFVDMAFNPQMPAQQIIYAKTLCTNRYLAEQLPYNALLSAEMALPVQQIACLDKPVPQVHVPQDGETLWQLISQLCVNHLSITSGPGAMDGLKEMLRLYTRGSRQGHFEIETLKDIEVKPITRRVNREAWRGFVRGHEVTFITEDTAQMGGSTFLLISVLRHYFSLHVGVNSFVEVVLKTDRSVKELMRWPSIPGTQISL